MPYEIKTIAYHKAELKRLAEQAARRAEFQMNVEDCALSSWSDNNLVTFHNKAIELLENGESLGIDGPAAKKLVLCERETETPVDAKLIHTQYGWCWLLGDDAAAYFGRRFVPSGSRSRVQKKLGLCELEILQPCGRWFKTYCRCIGSPVTFLPDFDD